MTTADVCKLMHAERENTNVLCEEKYELRMYGRVAHKVSGLRHNLKVEMNKILWARKYIS